MTRLIIGYIIQKDYETTTRYNVKQGLSSSQCIYYHSMIVWLHSDEIEMCQQNTLESTFGQIQERYIRLLSCRLSYWHCSISNLVRYTSVVILRSCELSMATLVGWGAQPTTSPLVHATNTAYTFVYNYNNYV